MADDGTRTGRATRREYVMYGSALVGGGLLAGCVGAGGSGRSSTAAGSGAVTGTTAETGGGPAEDSSYSVTMEPVGTVEFDRVPEAWFAYTGDYADMGVALGRADGLRAVGVRPRFGAHLYDELPGVSVDKGELTQLWRDGTGKEVFYELDADVHARLPDETPDVAVLYPAGVPPESFYPYLVGSGTQSKHWND